MGANVQNAATQNSFSGGLIQGGGEALAMMSDEDEKTDIAGAFGKVPGKTFEYKHPGADGEPAGKRIGVMAQDVDRQPELRSMVIEGKPMKLDVGNALGLALAAISAHEKEIEALKGKKAA